MQVVIEFEDAGSQRWSGRLRSDQTANGDLPFQGRLELLRLLETVVDDGHVDPSGCAE